MKHTYTKLSIALFSLALFAYPAEANFFHNKDTNVSRNIGSAPSPSPEDIRAAEGRLGTARDVQLINLVGRPVYGRNGDNLGTISDVDVGRNLVAVRLADQSAVALSINALYDDGTRVIAPRLTRAEFVAMPRIPDSEFDE